MNIKLKHPKYWLPLALLPLFLLVFYSASTWGANGKGSKATTDSSRIAQINPDLPDVSKQVEKEELKDKFSAVKEAYKNNKDYSALNDLGEKKTGNGLNYTTAYSGDEAQAVLAERRLDSLQRSLEQHGSSLDRNLKAMQQPARQREQPDAAAIYNRLKSRESVNETNETGHDEISVFREQMKLIDSMQKAGENTNNGQRTTANAKKINPLTDSTFKPLPVSLTGNNSSGFNTVAAFKPEESIRAILDQSEKGYAGTRVRIRLLQDINVGDNIVPKGSYIYGVITGFQTQRVNISISQIMLDGRPLPVRLDVFDEDGYLGLYVPSSNFREFSKEIGTQGTNGLSSVQTPNQDLTTSLLSKLFTTTTNSVNKVIRKDKAFLKYNYLVYLKERNQ